MSSAPGNESAASKLANTAGEAAANMAIIGAGALIVSGSVFAYNSLHKEEEAFTADGGEEFAQVCQDAKTGRRVEDSECEKAGEAANSSDSSSSSNSNSSSHNNSGSNSGTHNNQSHVTNAFLWYYIGSQAGRNGSIPAVGSSLTGGSTSRPSSGTVYSGVSSKGGGFESSYRSAKKTSTVAGGKVTSTTSGGKSSSAKSGSNPGSRVGSNKSGSNSGGSKSGSNSGSKSGGSKGGFGGGSKSGGGTSGG